jgi:ketosteroid isomerase-like protein
MTAERRSFEDDAWERMELTSLEILSAGNPVVVMGRLHQRACESGVELDSDYGSVYWTERGLIVRELHFTDRDETIRAAERGLS